MPFASAVPVPSSRDRSRSPLHAGNGPAFGTVKHFNESWGFLVSPEVAGDIFCHLRDSPQFTGPALQPGEAVTFELVQRPEAGRNNGLQATNVQRKSNGSMWQRGPMTMTQTAPMTMTDPWGGEPPVTGTVTKIRKGMAFCSVQGVAEDVLIGERSLMDSGINPATLKEGDSLTFAMAKGPKGYHGTNIQQEFGPGNWQMGRQTGTLKKVHGGMGFCHVAGIDGDVLLGSRSLELSGIDVNALVVGDALTFELSTGPKGYHANNIQRAMTAWHGQEGQGGQGGQRVAGMLKKIGDGMGFCSVDGVAGDVLLGTRSLIDSSVDLSTMQLGDTLFFDMNAGPRGYHGTNIQAVGSRVTGTLKKIGDGMGFCSVDGIAGDVLLGQRSLLDSGVDMATMQLGDSLTFELVAGPRGYSAAYIQLATVAPQLGSMGRRAVDAQPSKVGQRTKGTLKKIHKTMGFCSVEGIHGDVLLGERSLQEAGVDLTTMQLGQALEFDMHHQGSGRYHATNISLAQTSDWAE